MHGRAQLYRAVLEGVVYALKEGADITMAKLKKPFTRVRASGGGSQSELVLQITGEVDTSGTVMLHGSGLPRSTSLPAPPT